MFVFYTELVKKDVVDRHGRWIGHPYDFFARLDEAYPTLTSLVVSTSKLSKKFAVIPWNQLSVLDDRIQVKVRLETLATVKQYREPAQTTLRTSVLDQQVVDTFNRKVVRVNDIHFLRVEGGLRLIHVDVGMRGLIRRLGWERTVDFLVRVFHRHARYLTTEGFISWKYIQPLDIQPHTGKLKLNVEQEELKKIPPPDLSEMLMELDPPHRVALFRTMDVQSQVDILTEWDLKWQKALIEDLDTRTAVELFERMPADEATDLLGELSRRDADRILSMISTQKARTLSELLEHESDSAGGLMTTEFITLREEMTVDDAIGHIKKTELRKAETIYHAYVIDDAGRLVGTVSFRSLLIAPLQSLIRDVMLAKPPSVHVEASAKEVAFMFDKYNFFALPAVDDDDKLEGIITIDDVLSVVVNDAYGKKAGL